MSKRVVTERHEAAGEQGRHRGPSFGDRARALAGRLTRPERTLVDAASDAFFPAGGPIALSGSEAGAAGYLQGYLDRTPPLGRVLIRLLIAFTELGPLAFGPRRRRFTALSPADQQRCLQQAFTSRLYFRRIAFISLRALLTMAYLSCPAVAASMGMVADRDPFGIGGGEAATAAGHEGEAAAAADPLKQSGTRRSAARGDDRSKRHSEAS